jgi:hypothetical protein
MARRAKHSRHDQDRRPRGRLRLPPSALFLRSRLTQPVLSLERHGTYYRVYKPDWHDPLDTSYAKRSPNNRWNPPGVFGALYLDATLDVAAANARSQHAGRAIGLFDLRPERRPWLVSVAVPRSRVLDVVTPAGISRLKLPKHYPFGVAAQQCWPIARRAYSDSTLWGVACRSAAECTKITWIGEELAWFDRAPRLRETAPRRAFEEWYPDVKP